MAERSKARVYGRSLAGVAGSNPAGDMDVCVVQPGQSGQSSSTVEVQREREKVPVRAKFFAIS